MFNTYMHIYSQELVAHALDQLGTSIRCGCVRIYIYIIYIYIVVALERGLSSENIKRVWLR